MAVEKFLGTRPQRAFMSTIAIQAVAVIVLVAITFSKINSAVAIGNAQFKTTSCYLALFAFAELFELIMAYNALRMRNTIQLVAMLIFHVALIVVAALQAYEFEYSINGHDSDADLCGNSDCSHLWHQIEPFVIAIPSIIFMAWLVMIACARYLYFEFGWAIFHVVGASPRMKVMYQWYQVMICFLKFDFFCFIGVTMQMLIVVRNSNPTEFAVTIAAIPVVFVLLVFAGIAVKREIKWLMSASLVLMLAAESYFIYKLVRFFQPSSSEQYISTRTTLTFFTILAFIILFATFAVGLRCFADFDKGLLNAKTTTVAAKPSGYSKPTTPGYANGEANARQSYFAGGEPLQHRMSIE